ncbi:energy transducer TonB [Algibacter amylolyticus]|nr:energy transducer TonB [Algibacter amylolyticus]MBB5267111.1 TonB family protein [Algibacter amylolyticus]
MPYILIRPLIDNNVLHLNNQHKSLLITLLISGTVVLSVFNLSLKQQDKYASESYYLMEPEEEPTEEDIKAIEALENRNNAKAETNDAFNETQKAKHFAQAYKTIAPPEDYVPKTNTSSNESAPARKTYEIPEVSSLNSEELSKFSKVNDLLKKQQSDGNNSKSSIRYSLLNRKKIHIPIPVYLCEVDGKIVVNITVNANGKVVDAYVNNSSTSNNACLMEHAIDYAKRSRFTPDAAKESQIGTITFFFIGK